MPMYSYTHIDMWITSSMAVEGQKGVKPGKIDIEVNFFYITTYPNLPESALGEII